MDLRKVLAAPRTGAGFRRRNSVVTKWQFEAAWRLAEELEMMRARERAGRERRDSKLTWHWFYDPHAATELASLIYNRLTTRPADAKKEVP
jgi:hypothetical protein